MRHPQSKRPPVAPPPKLRRSRPELVKVTVERPPRKEIPVERQPRKAIPIEDPRQKQRGWSEKTRLAVLRVEPEPQRANKKVDTTPPWPFPRREVTIKSSEWQVLWKKIRDKTARDLERDNNVAQETIKALLDERDELRAQVNDASSTVDTIALALTAQLATLNNLVKQVNDIKIARV